MLRKQRKGWIAAVVLILLLSASAPAAAAGPERGGDGSWIVRLLGWLGLPPSVTSVWDFSSGYIDPLGQPGPNSAGTDDSGFIDPDGKPGSAGTDDSAHIDPDG
jgi:hypothetical protein